MKDVIIKIATITDNRRTYDYINLTHLKFSNKEDFSDDFKVLKISIIMNDESINEIEIGGKLPKNVENDIKYVKLILFSDKWQKEQIKEYHIKMLRSIGVERIDGKSIAVVSHNYVLHNPDDYAYKYYMGYSVYAKEYYIDGQRVAKYLMSYRSKLNKVNNIADSNGVKTKLASLKNIKMAEEDTAEPKT